MQDPFSVASSAEVVDVPRNGIPGVNTAFSVDVEELLYSIPDDKLFIPVLELIEYCGPVGFQNACGMSVDAFLEHLFFSVLC